MVLLVKFFYILLISDNKKEGEFPAMNWKDTINNMHILENWKKKLYEKQKQK